MQWLGSLFQRQPIADNEPAAAAAGHQSAAAAGTEKTELKPVDPRLAAWQNLVASNNAELLRLQNLKRSRKKRAREEAAMEKVEQWLDAGGGGLCTVQQLGEVPTKATQTRRARTARERAATPPVFEESHREAKRMKRDEQADREIALYWHKQGVVVTKVTRVDDPVAYIDMTHDSDADMVRGADASPNATAP
jgi:hypothetical protein